MGASGAGSNSSTGSSGSSALAYYTAHDVLTDPGAYADRLNELPATLPELHTALDGLLIHAWKVRAYHPQLFAPVGREVFVRHTSRLRETVLRLDPAPLSVPRPVERRAVVDCRHFAVLLCAALRHHSVPARPRCGFATYLEGGVAVDHWVGEVWDAVRNRWVLEDADKQRHDVPRDEFLTGADAWQRCHEDPAFAERIGYDAKTRGLRVARANLVRDMAALNGFPSVSGDSWGLGHAAEAALTSADVELLDHVAELAARARWARRRCLRSAAPCLRGDAGATRAGRDPQLRPLQRQYVAHGLLAHRALIRRSGTAPLAVHQPPDRAASSRSPEEHRT